MQIDYVINRLNARNTFKVIAFLILSFPTFQNYLQFQNILTALVTPKFVCIDQRIDSSWIVHKTQCTLTKNASLEKCSVWRFSLEPVGYTMVSEFDLVCDKSHYGEMLMILWYLASLTSPFAGYLADKYGRKKVTISCLCLETICISLMARSTTFYENMVLRFLLGVSGSGLTIAWVWLMESVNVGFRDFIGSFFYMHGCMAYMISPLITYLTKNWRTSQLISIFPSVVYLFVYFIPESPRWLLSLGKRNEAFNSIYEIASINKIKVNFKEQDITYANESKDCNLRRAFKSSVFLHRVMMAILLQFSNSLFYSAISINLTILSSDILLSMFFLGLMEMLSLFISFLSLRYQKRKRAIVMFGGIGSTLFFINTFFNNDVYWQSVVRLVIGCVAKISICCVYQASMTFAIELFPTSHRSFCIVLTQIFNFLSFVGAIYINKLSSAYFFLPMTIYMLVLWICCLLAYHSLPETKGLPFPETVHDQEMLIKNKEEEFVKYMKGRYLAENDSQYSKEIILLNEVDNA